MLVAARSFWLLALLIVAPTCASPPAGAEPPGRILVRVVPRPVGDDLLVARVGQHSTRLERWKGRPWRRVTACAVADPLTDVVPGRDGMLLLVSARHLETVPADLSRPPRRIWQAPAGRTILRAVRFQTGWLVLAALASEGVRDGHLRGGLVYYIRPKRQGGFTAKTLTLLPRYNFWELQVGDVDGDGRPEIALCTWSKTNRISTYARRFFVYGWRDARGDVFPRWRGSRLSKPYRQARLVRLGAQKNGAHPGDRLLSVEETRTGRRCLTLYRWNDFGFTGVAGSAEFERISIVLGSTDAPTLVRAVSRGETRELLYELNLPHGDRLALRLLGALPSKTANVVVGRFGGAPAGWKARVVADSNVAGAKTYSLRGAGDAPQPQKNRSGGS